MNSIVNVDTAEVTQAVISTQEGPKNSNQDENKDFLIPAVIFP